MWDPFHSVGVDPVSHRRVKRLCRAVFSGAGRIFRRALGMPSGPGALSFARRRKVRWKVESWRTVGRRVGYLFCVWWWACDSRVNGSCACGKLNGYGAVASREGSAVHSLRKWVCVWAAMSAGCVRCDFVSGL